jgi:hypothetical protein
MIVGTKWTCPPMLCGGNPDLSGVIVDLRNTVIDKKSRGNQEVNWIK